TLAARGGAAPGITGQISRVRAESGARLNDVERVVVPGLLPLGFAVEVERPEPVLKDLLFAAKSLGLEMEYRKLAPGDGVAQRERYALTAIARSLGAPALRSIAEALAAHGANIERINRLSEGALQCVEFAISLAPDALEAELKRALLAAAGQGAFDCALQRETLLRRSKRLVVMDMDSTLIRIEVIDELARAHGVGGQVAAITRR